ncbi:ABC transporter ATP-binding protein [Chryseolinea sp. H1M3-3]|uniref:ABC transporter ATP-binding protein n=1 Tax=Chryseolinea sp. H1M3-3 TaxID=3034144 RepID=UPI0023ED668C|nr:ABC transporter ATP-binding protein [Chryseolinea sp. H1M3-3]
MEVISTISVSKFFNKTSVLDNVSIQVNEGEIYGFLGLNGAGKTTLIRILLGMIRPNEGVVKLFGKVVGTKFNSWNDIGYLVETPCAYPNLSVNENLKVMYELRHLKNRLLIPAIIDRLKLTAYTNTKSKNLSLGNQQRLGLAKALMHQPKLLILDEPINGLDPEGIVEVRELLKELVGKGSTVFLSSHILGEISKIASRIAIIDHGKLLQQMPTEELKHKLIKSVLIKTNDNRQALKHLIDRGYQASLKEGDEVEVKGEKAVLYPEHIAKLLVDHEMDLKQLYVHTEDLEMFFLRAIRT